MRGLVLVIVFFSLLPLVFKRPYVGILMWFWISLMSPHRLVYGFAENISFALIVALVTLGSWLFLHPEEPKAPPGDRVTFLILALMAWVSISSMTGVGPPEQIHILWDEAEKMLLMTLVAYTLTNTRERFDHLVLVCVLSIAFFGVKGGVFAILTGGSERVFGPPGTIIGDNNDLGTALAMILPMLFYLQQRYTHPYLKWPMRILIGLTVVGNLFTYSRAALVALAAMASVLWLRTRQKIAIGAAIAIAVVGMLFFAPPQWSERMHTIQTYDQDASAESRLWIWHVSWLIAMERPISGAGFRWYGNWRWANDQIRDSGLRPMTMPRAPHSIWFAMVSHHGFIGLALFVGFFVVAAMDTRWLIRRSRGNPDLAWANNFGRMLQVALVGYAVGGSFASLEMYDGFYVLVILGAAARRIVAAELAAQERVSAAPIAGAAPAPAAAAVAPQARAGQPLIRT